MPLIPKRSRIAPAEPPFDDDTGAALDAPGPPLGLFRVWARRPDRAHAIAGWGRYCLSRRGALSLRHRPAEPPDPTITAPEVSMSKGYWVSVYRSISDPEKVAAYNVLAAAAVRAGGGRTFVRGGRVEVYESGIAERTVLVEFDSFEQAVATRESAAYRAALDTLADAVERDFRIVEGID